MIPPAYSPYDPAYKTPFGAVRAGEKVTFRVRLHKDAAPSAVYLLLEGDGGNPGPGSYEGDGESLRSGAGLREGDGGGSPGCPGTPLREGDEPSYPGTCPYRDGGENSYPKAGLREGDRDGSLGTLLYGSGNENGNPSPGSYEGDGESLRSEAGLREGDRDGSPGCPGTPLREGNGGNPDPGSYEGDGESLRSGAGLREGDRDGNPNPGTLLYGGGDGNGNPGTCPYEGDGCRRTGSYGTPLREGDEPSGSYGTCPYRDGGENSHPGAGLREGDRDGNPNPGTLLYGGGDGNGNPGTCPYEGDGCRRTGSYGTPLREGDEPSGSYGTCPYGGSGDGSFGYPEACPYRDGSENSHPGVRLCEGDRDGSLGTSLCEGDDGSPNPGTPLYGSGDGNGNPGTCPYEGGDGSPLHGTCPYGDGSENSHPKAGLREGDSGGNPGTCPYKGKSGGNPGRPGICPGDGNEPSGSYGTYPYGGSGDGSLGHPEACPYRDGDGNSYPGAGLREGDSGGRPNHGTPLYGDGDGNGNPGTCPYKGGNGNPGCPGTPLREGDSGGRSGTSLCEGNGGNPGTGTPLYGSGDGSLCLNMTYLYEEDGLLVFGATPRFAEGLYFYSFAYDAGYGRRYLVKGPDGAAGISGERGEGWQLTVYREDYRVPDCYAGGIYYQIFPDRFCNSGREKHGVPGDRCLRGDWGGAPEYRQTGGTRSLGNDYFGGDLAGITEKMDYIASLGVTAIYLNPIFEAHSNHRYNTADYTKIDPLLGTEGDFRELCRAAHRGGIRVILDGVFSHTGDDSVYFNKYGRYPAPGAYSDRNSPYYPWYKFTDWPDGVKCWWGVPSLPEVAEEDPGFTAFITGEGGVIDKWLDAGADGFRLDVADELPDGFLDAVRRAVKRHGEDKLLIGEVWEDASNKVSYGARRRFLRGGQLDSVTNYPFREAVLEFVRGGRAEDFVRAVLEICEHYPAGALKLLMNPVGTHDTPRSLTALAGENLETREEQAAARLSPAERETGLRLQRIAALLQYTLPGLPVLYYGDEAGLEGYGDPFCRGCYPWGSGDTALVEFYRALGAARRGCGAFREGEFVPLTAEGGALLYERRSPGSAALVAVNRGAEPYTFRLPEEFAAGGGRVRSAFGSSPGAGTLSGSEIFSGSGVSLSSGASPDSGVSLFSGSSPDLEASPGSGAVSGSGASPGSGIFSGSGASPVFGGSPGAGTLTLPGGGYELLVREGR